MPAPVVRYPFARKSCGSVVIAMPRPSRAECRKYGSMVHTWVVSGRSPVRKAVREGAHTAMETKARWNCVPRAARRSRLGVCAGKP